MQRYGVRQKEHSQFLRESIPCCRGLALITKNTRPQPSAIIIHIPLYPYLRTVAESNRDFFVPADRDVLDHASPKTAVKFEKDTIL